MSRSRASCTGVAARGPGSRAPSWLAQCSRSCERVAGRSQQLMARPTCRMACKERHSIRLISSNKAGRPTVWHACWAAKHHRATPLEQVGEQAHCQPPCNGQGAAPALCRPVHAARSQAQAQVAHLERAARSRACKGMVGVTTMPQPTSQG
jgi:hypothetical protein